MAEAEKEVRPNIVADKLSRVATGVTFFATIAALALVFPIGGAWYLGAMAAHAGAGALGTIGAGAVGLVAGMLPYGVVNAVASKKDPSYGTLEAMCKPAAFVSEAVQCVLSPRYGLHKLKNAFSRASQKPADVQPQQPAPQPPAAKPDAPTQG
jgi:hypothetical protein